MKQFNNNKGYTLIELLIALVMTSIMTIAGYQFYSAMHNQAITQGEISDLQQNSRNILQEMVTTARMAGYKVGGHAPYEISGDSLMIFFSDTQPVDTVLYYLDDYGDFELAYVELLPEDQLPKKLMRKINSAPAVPYSDMVTSLTFDTTSVNTLEITLAVQVSKPDQTLIRNGGVRTYTFTERVILRNVI